MAVFEEKYRESYSNAEIAASATEQFVVTAVQRDRYGSANSLIVSSKSDNQAEVFLDDNDSFAILQPNGAIIIKPEDGIFFDSVKIENLGSDAIAADAIKVRMAKADQV